jgi:site-specific DNA-methyltransferase (adenine-specific)
MNLPVNQIICGDCLEVMKQIDNDSVDMILTDPPYGMNFQSNYRKEKHDKIIGDNNLEWIHEFVQQSYRVSRENTAHYIFCSFHCIDIFKQAFQKLFTIKNILVWEKNNTSMGDLAADFAPKVEFVLFVQKGRKLINGKRDPNIFKFNRTGNNFHPTEKPVSMFSYLITKFSDKQNTVLDPFVGSGTTAIACINTGRNFIGIEKEQKYVDIANKRIEQTKRQLSLFP